ncbi:MAG TPA: RDD family protein [Kofleriaceae bacterium]
MNPSTMVNALRVNDNAKLVREIVTPEGIPLRFTLARAGDRAAAFALDMLIQIAILVAVGVGLRLAVADSDSWLTAVIVILVFLLLNFYFAVFEVRWQGATPGKRKIGIRVIDARGGQLETSAVLARNLIRELEVWIPLRLLFIGQIVWPDAPGWARLLAGAWGFVFLFMPVFNKDRLRVGDMIAGTRVVMQPKVVLVPDLVDETIAAAAAPRPAAPGAAPASAYMFSDAQLAIYGIYELQVLEGVLRINPGDPAHREVLRTVADKVRAKIRYEGNVPDDERFLRDFYAAQRAHLEQKLLFGQRRQDKFSK